MSEHLDILFMSVCTLMAMGLNTQKGSNYYSYTILRVCKDRY